MNAFEGQKPVVDNDEGAGVEQAVDAQVEAAE
ncbi:MAG: hypothetical protein ACD_43C00253G0001, partial [uncultured bacterium]